MSVLSACVNAYIKGKKIIFFGAGEEGSASFLRLQNASKLLSYFVDNAPDKQGKKLFDICIFDPGKLKHENDEDVCIIITAVDYIGIADQLLHMGFSDIYASTYKDANEKICATDKLSAASAIERKTFNDKDVNAVKGLFADELSTQIYSKIINKYKHADLDFSDVYSNEPMYFNDIFKEDLTPNEVYIDAGVHSVKSIIDFIFYTKGKYKKIYAFEPDGINYNALYNDLTYFQGVELFKYGLSDKNKEVLFDMRGNGGSCIVNEESSFSGTVGKVKVVSLDTFLNDVPSFIKMDVEGAEYEALNGASECIKAHMPKLAISLYHKVDDLIRVPLFINKLVPEYKLYLRHHRTNYFETVLYAKM